MASGQSGDRQKKRGRRLKNVFLLYNNRRNTKYNRRKQKIKKKNDNPGGTIKNCTKSKTKKNYFF